MSELSTAANNIYNRLRAAPTFHPASADLFSDWNVQSGDVVTVKADGESYQVPVYNMKLKWSGAPKVEVESTGNPEREPLPAIKRREYAANSSNYSEQKSLRGGVGAAQSGVREINGILYAAGLQVDPVTGVWLYASEKGADYALGSSFKVQADSIASVVEKTGINDLGQSETLYTRIVQTESDITTEVARAQGAETTIGSRVTQNADSITAIVSKTGVDNLDAGETLYSKITQTAGQISTEVTNRQNADSRLSSRITQTENNIALVVTNGSISAASIVAAINGAGSSVTISADHVDLEGYVTVSKLTGQGASVYGLLAADDGHYYGALTVDGTADVGNLAVNGLGFFYHKHELSASESNGVITITEGNITSDNVSVNFNIADTKFYKDAVSAAEASGKKAMGLALNSDEHEVSVAVGSTKSLSVSSYVELVYNQNTHKYTAMGSAKVGTTTMHTATPVISGTEAYDAGKTKGANDVTISEVNGSVGDRWGTYYYTVTMTAKASNNATGSNTVSVNAVGAYDAGKTKGANDVTINKGTWSKGSISFTKSEGTASTKTVSLTLSATQNTSTDANKWTVVAKDGNSNTGASVTVDASSRYTAGYNAGYTAGYSAGGGGASYTAKSYTYYGRPVRYNDSTDKYEFIGPTGYWFVSANKTLYEKN